MTIWWSNLAAKEAKGSSSGWRPQLGRLKLGEKNPNQDNATAAEIICGAATERNMTQIFLTEYTVDFRN